MARKTLRTIACLLATASQRAHGQVWVMSPESLVQTYAASQGGIIGATSTFGAPFYGDRVLGQLVYAEPRRNSGCTEDDYEVEFPGAGSGGNYEGAKLIKIVMVRYGKECSITTKVRVAYNKGAHAVIVVDKEESTFTSRDMSKIMVKDDGTGDSIRIPSILVSKEDGRNLIDTVKKSEVIIELKWTIPTNAVVTAELWMSSASRESLRFLRDFAPNRRKLNRVLAFRPRYSIFSVSAQDHHTVEHLCYDAEGRFCTQDPDGSGRLTGKDVILEDVRQLCIHELYSKQHLDGQVKYSEQYWHYVERFPDACPLDRFGDSCSRQLMVEVGIDPALVQRCLEVNVTKKLGEELRSKAWSPRALRINGWRYSGALSADLVTRAVCSGFTTRPAECEELLTPRDPFQAYAPEGHSGVSMLGFVSWMLAFVLLGFVLLVLYKRYMEKDIRATLREEVMLEVQSAMSQYAPMK